MDPLSVRLIRAAVAYPTIRVASRPERLLMGVYDEAGHYVEDTVLDRRTGERGGPMPRDLFPEVVDSEVPEAIYAGPLYFHFGHFLLESLARAWYARRHPQLTLAWAGQHDWQDLTLAPWQLEILEILELPNPTSIVADPTRVELLHVPDIGYRYDDRFHPEHAEFLGHYPGPGQVPGQRLWLSRSKVENEARDVNAGATERRLVEAGWTVAHPESLSIRDQLDHLARAETVAGEEGSAFHALVLLQDVAAKRFHILRRHGREQATCTPSGTPGPWTRRSPASNGRCCSRRRGGSCRRSPPARRRPSTPSASPCRLCAVAHRAGRRRPTAASWPACSRSGSWTSAPRGRSWSPGRQHRSGWR